MIADKPEVVTSTTWAVRCDKTGHIYSYGDGPKSRWFAEQEVARRADNSKLTASKLPTGTLVYRVVTRTYSATEWCPTTPDVSGPPATM